MSCDLERLFGSLATTLSRQPDAEIRLTATTLPRPTALLTTDRLYATRGLHEYDPGAFRAHVAHFHAYKTTYQQLGLLILAVVFHPDLEEVTIELTHPASTIKRLVVESPFRVPYDIRPGYNTRPYVFNYPPSAPSRFPWPDIADPTIMPCFYFINQEILRGFGSDTGSVRLAELLLNAGQTGNPEAEYVLEGDGGYRGVGYLSAEAHLWLPGSAAWDPTQWEPEA
jgi:hypothetical protein